MANFFMKRSDRSHMGESLDFIQGFWAVFSMHHAVAIRAKHCKILSRVQIDGRILGQLCKWRQMVGLDVSASDLPIDHLKIEPTTLADIATPYVTDMWRARRGFWMPELRVVESRICGGSGGFGRWVEPIFGLGEPGSKSSPASLGN